MESTEKHLAGYQNAQALTIEQTAIVERLTTNLIGDITEAASTAKDSLRHIMIGRRKIDIYRRAGLESVTKMQAAGHSSQKSAAEMTRELRQNGITAFIDRAGRKWSLYAYANTVTRTTARQAEILGLLTADPDQDLYKISSHGTTCPICAPLEGRVYSRSGKNPDYPPLAAAFGKIDPSGPNELNNTYLNIHPNCLHALIPYTLAGRSKEEIQRDKEYSSFKKNPPSVDPRSEAQIKAYRKKEQGRQKYMNAYKEYQTMRIVLGEDVSKTFQTFLKHKVARDDKYQGWVAAYQEMRRLD